MPDHLLPLISSPWLYVLVFAAVAVDGFLPVVPAEAAVISLGALSATGTPSLAPLAVAVVAGGVAGDRVAYLLGRGAGGRITSGRPASGRPAATVVARDRVADLLGRLVGGRLADGRLADGRLAAAKGRAERALLRHGGAAILVGRFLPYGRTATAMTSGSVSLPPARFRLFSALAGAAWAAYTIGLGRLGGSAFADSPLLGAASGMAFGLLLAGAHHVMTAGTPGSRRRYRFRRVPRKADLAESPAPGGRACGDAAHSAPGRCSSTPPTG
jgi:membrane-associated protein